MWQETNTSVNGDRWDFANILCVPVSLAITDYGFRYRIGENVYRVTEHATIDNAKARVITHFKALAKTLVSQL